MEHKDPVDCLFCCRKLDWVIRNPKLEFVDA